MSRLFRTAETWAWTLLAVGFAAVAAALALKAAQNTPRGRVVLSPGEAVEIGEDVLVLSEFTIPKYPSGKPRQYLSEVELLEGERVTTGEIAVNRPLIWNGRWIYQSASAPDGSSTVLEVVEDRYLPLAAFGGVLLLLGAALGAAFWRVPPRPGHACRTVRALAATLVFAVPLAVILRAVTRAEPIPALQSPFMVPHVAAYAASYLILILAAFGIARRFMGLGFLLMTLGLVLGAVWGKFCWGDFWQYDPKEMASLFTWLVYALYFALRHRPRWEFALRIVGAAMAVMTATWVNFSRIFAGLHSYA